MPQLNASLRNALLRYPEIRIVSDGADLGSARDFVQRVGTLAGGRSQDQRIPKALERLIGIAAIGVNVGLLDGQDLARFDRLIEEFSFLAKTPPGNGLADEDFEFLASYGRFFDKDYFVAGTTSAYKNYGWAYYNPALTVPRVEAILQAITLPPCSKVLDFGCAVGFYVHSFLAKGFEATGIDISPYAIENAHPGVKERLSLLHHFAVSQLQRVAFDLVLVKDVLEHVPEVMLNRLWAILAGAAKVLVVTVPVANSEGEYINAEDKHDLTHVVRKDAAWWMNLFGRSARRDNELCAALKGQKAKGTLCAIVDKRTRGQEAEMGAGLLVK